METASDGDKAKTESAGFSVQHVPPPEDVLVLPSDHASTADLRWKAVVIERTPEGPEPQWTVIGNSTRKQATLSSMVSRTKYWFRVAAIGAADQSDYSDPLPLFAP